ncbi:hypothetical protein [Lysinibacillus sp. NPDC093216]|uniref:hypothetical protein n=1 Tax=Lysinibacillus sp. NPDC093216 TaxID=3390576 RepID=UPI003CFE09F8
MHQDVADKVIEIDELIEICNFNSDVSDENSEELADLYTGLIDLIKKHLKDYRVKNIKNL